MSRVVRIPNSNDLRKIRQRAIESAKCHCQTCEDRRSLIALLDDIIGQAHEGAFVEHECPALFACTYIIAQTSAPEECAQGKDSPR